MIWENRGYNCWRHDPRLKDRQTEETSLEADKEENGETEHHAVYGWPGIRF
jgi:hypothetical protein